MFNGWECPRCHNIYAPGAPFCVFCWFQNNSNLINTKPVEQPVAVVDPVITPIAASEPLTIAQPEPIKVEVITPVIKEKQEINEDKYPDTQIYLMGIAHSKERALTRNFIIPHISDVLQDFPATPTTLVNKYFAYIKDNNINFLFDSNISYLLKNKKSLNVKDVIRQYCYYINEYNIEHFFDLDCAPLLSEVELGKLRQDIFDETHKRPIPIFNKEMPRELWTNMCKENDIICIGRFADGDIGPGDLKDFEEKCAEAHSYGTKVHAIGLAPLSLLNTHKVPFDSVSTSNWSRDMRKLKTVLVDGMLDKQPIPEDTPFLDTQVANLQAWAEFCSSYTGAAR